jgi:LacI family transcriptional regulator
MPFQGEEVNLRDVAALAKVSLATASKAINARFDVSEQTRTRVLAAAETLGYKPNMLARSLTVRKSGTVGVIVNDLERNFALPVLSGVEDALSDQNIFPLLCDARGDEVRERLLIRELLSRKIDGLIFIGHQTDKRTSYGDALGIPTVYAYAQSENSSDFSVSIDNHQVGALATQHLIDTGRSKIVHISGEAPHSASLDRAAGFLSVLRSNDLKPATRPMFGDWSEGWGRAAVQSLLKREIEFDAIFCASDQIARGVLDMLHREKISVPDTVAVIGIDNWKVIAANSRPALTSVDLNFQRLGRTAVHLLSNELGHHQGPGTVRIPGTLVIRDSTVFRS